MCGVGMGTAFSLSGVEKTAEQAWATLTGNMGKRAMFSYVETRSELPDVLVYGDSISVGYTLGVRQALAERVNVHRIHLNGGDSSSFIQKFNDMESAMRAPNLEEHWDFDWDVIHVNVGLHDLKYINDRNKLDLENGELVTTVQKYSQNLHQIIAHLNQTAPEAKLIFALTTKVPPGSGGRIEESELSYNAAALAVLSDYPNIAVNNLRTVSLPYEQPGNVHFKPEGIAAQAKHVAEVIATHLPAKR